MKTEKRIPLTSANITLYSVTNDAIPTVSDTARVGIDGNETKRIYAKLTMPSDLPIGAVLNAVTLTLSQEEDSLLGNAPLLALYGATPPTSETAVPIADSMLLDYAPMLPTPDEGVRTYSLDVTRLFGSTLHPGASVWLLLRAHNESAVGSITLCGPGLANAPVLTVTYEVSYGEKIFGKDFTHEISPFMSGTVDLFRGNLLLTLRDVESSGSRMPVSIRHHFNSKMAGYRYKTNAAIGLHVANYESTGLGKGWRLNLMQSLLATENGFVYTDEAGEEFLLLKEADPSTTYCSTDGSITYKEGSLHVGDEVLTFISGKLYSITDAHGNFMRIEYASNGQVSKVTDGAGRTFDFQCSPYYLQKITAPSGETVTVNTTSDRLTEIRHTDGAMELITYDGDLPTSVTYRDGMGCNNSIVLYSYDGGRISAVAEYGFDTEGEAHLGKQTAFAYSDAGLCTKMTVTEGEEAEAITTVHLFDRNGNLVNEYSFFGHVDASENENYAQNPYVANEKRMTDDARNLLKNHRMHPDNTEGWGIVGDATLYPYYEYSPFGGPSIYMRCSRSETTDPLEQGIYQRTARLPVGDYSFSVYAAVDCSAEDNGMLLCIKKSDGTVIAKSELFSRDLNFKRNILHFTLSEESVIDACILGCGSAILYLAAAQLEANAAASAYNMLENPDVREDAWQLSDGVSLTSGDSYGMHRTIVIPGSLSELRSVSQSVTAQAPANYHETFMLVGWARMSGLPIRDRGESIEAPIFRLRARFTYRAEREVAEDGSVRYSTPTEDVMLDFCPDTTGWQRGTLVFAKGQYKNIEKLEIFCESGYQDATAYFSDIQLLRCDFTTEMTPEELIGNASNAAIADGVTEREHSNSYLSWFEAPEYEDGYGNVLTETLGAYKGHSTLYRTFTYSDNANDLVAESDHRGNTTQHTVNSESSRTTCTTDRVGHETHYEYDVNGRVSRIWEGATANGAPTVSYTYTPTGEIAGVLRGDGMEYYIGYDAFHRQTAIGVRGISPLVGYTYTNAGTLPKTVSYPNGHRMEVTYNRYGQPMAERWYKNNASIPYAYYKYSYDGEGNVVRALDMVAKKEYTYSYENGQLSRSAESDITVDENGNVTEKVLLGNVNHFYYKDTAVRQLLVGGNEALLECDRDVDDGITTRKIKLRDGCYVTIHASNDELGRRACEELYLGGTHHITRTYTYCEGVLPDLHKQYGLEKLTPTTRLVKELRVSGIKENGYAVEYCIGYEYDAEDRITRITDSLGNDTEYRYDERGQLTHETGHNIITYDKYGNILKKDGKTYTYGYGAWKDLLTSYGGQSIVYDQQGNPTTYLGHTLSWEKGRQLKSYDAYTYAYDMAGLRTSKTVNGVTHRYMWEGGKLLCEQWGNHTLVPLYDSADAVCGIKYDNTAYFFLKNLQGDVIGITDSESNVVTRYYYDAWGHCEYHDSVSGFEDIAETNPFRYRGYYYDTETGLYYLQSRYYDPVVGRFINADDVNLISYTNSNLFSYCSNDCINKIDFTGYLSFRDIWGLINTSFDFIRTTLEQIAKSIESLPSASQVKKLAKQSNKSQRQIMRELKKSAEESEKCLKYLGKVAKVAKLITIILFAIHLVQFGKSVFYDVYELLVEVFVEAAGYIIGEIVSIAFKTIPYAGAILGVVGSYMIGLIVSRHFTSSRKKKMTAAYISKVKNSTRWYDWLWGLFTSISATF